MACARAAVERAMKVQEVILRAIDGQLTCARSPAEGDGMTSDDRMYTCPMHPEVRQRGPGIAPSVAWRWSP